MIRYESAVHKRIAKRHIPVELVRIMHRALVAVDETRDLTLFDVRELRGEFRRTYYRLRKGKYRAIFFFDETGIAVVEMGKREEVYRLWE